MSVSAGELDRRITVQVATPTRDGAGDVILDWREEDRFKIWASKKDLRGFETVSAQELIRTADTVFEIRRSARTRAIAPEHYRIEFQGKLYTIVSIQEGKTRDDSIVLLTSSRPDGQGARGAGNVDGE